MPLLRQGVDDLFRLVVHRAVQKGLPVPARDEPFHLVVEIPDRSAGRAESHRVPGTARVVGLCTRTEGVCSYVHDHGGRPISALEFFMFEFTAIREPIFIVPSVFIMQHRAHEELHVGCTRPPEVSVLEARVTRPYSSLVDGALVEVVDSSLPLKYDIFKHDFEHD